MRTSRNLLTLILGSMLVISAGCDDGPSTGEGLTIFAVADASSVTAGQTVTVECRIGDAEEGELVDDAKLVVKPDSGRKIDGLVITPETAGTYEVECKSDALPLAASEPDSFVATPAAAARTIASVNPENISAGESADVTCIVVDEFGNPIDGLESFPENTEKIDADGMTVTSTSVGAFEVTCSAPEGTGELGKTPAILQVSAGRPVELKMSIDPKKDNYKINDVAMVKWFVIDAWGNRVNDVETVLEIDPEQGLDVFQNKLTVKAEGRWVVSVHARELGLSASDVMVCDRSAPELFIEWPPRGATVEGSPDVVVRGTVTDAAGSSAALGINGKGVAIGEDGRFEMPMTSIHGLNGLKFTVSDANGFEYWTTRGFYYSDEWHHIDAESAMSDVIRSDGAMIFLGQDFLDDGDHDRSHPNDLATILEILLASNLGGLLDQIPPISVPIPNIVNFSILGVGLQGDLNIEVQLRDISFGEPYVQILTREGGISTNVTMQPVTVGMDLKFTIKARAVAFGNTYDLLDPSTSSGSSMEIGTFGLGLSIDINKTPGQDVTIEGKDFELTIQDIQLDPIEHLEIDLGTIGPLGIDLGVVDLTRIVGSIDDLLMNWVLEPILNFLTPLLTNLLEPLVTELMGTLLTTLFDQLVLNQTVELPELAAGSGTTPMDLSLAPSTIVFTPDGGTIGMELGFLTAREVEHEIPGVIGSLTEAAGDAFAFDRDPGVQAAIDIQTINTLLFMIWQSGMISGQIDLSSLVEGVGMGVGNLFVTPDLYLPPIINDSAVGEDGMMSLEIGDAYIQLQVDLLGNPQFIDLWLQMAIQVQIVMKGNEVGIRFGDVTFFQTEFGDLGDLEGLVGMFLPMIPDLIKGIEGQEFVFPIPEIDLSSIIPGLGGSAVIQLGNGLSTVRDGMVVFGADLI